jgi:Na+:H+ antiporter, NhaA family
MTLGVEAENGRQGIRPLKDFLATEAAGGILLCLAALAALVWANSPWHGSYDSLWGTKIGLHVGSFHRTIDLHHLVNEALMTLFFFVVGLEIKREFVEGELRDRKRAALPIVAALGGMVVPAALYALITANSNGAQGWGVPMATDIAMALGALAIFGKHLHPSHKLFLLTLAIVDDIGAVVVIALFYSNGIKTPMLVGAVASLALVVVLQRVGLRSVTGYVIVGLVAWFLLRESGVHATLVGVAFGLLTPTKPALTDDLIDREELADISDFDAAQRTVDLARASVSVVERLEHQLHPWTSFVIVPLFAFANAGIRLDGDSLRAAASSRITIGIVVGLVIGKIVGITLASYIAVRFGVATLFEGLTWRTLLGVAALGGIGFTVSLFIAELAFVDAVLDAQAKVGVLAATTIAALVGAVLLRDRTRRYPIAVDDLVVTGDR